MRAISIVILAFIFFSQTLFAANPSIIWGSGGYAENLAESGLKFKSGQTIDDTSTHLFIPGELRVDGGLWATGTTDASVPCPRMTQSQRDGITGGIGYCVFNTDTDRFNIHDGTGWVEVPVSGDVSATLQDAYDKSPSGEVVVDSTRGALKVQDNATPIGANLFEILSNDGLTEYIAAAIDSFVSNVATTINAALDVVGNFSVTGNSTLTGTLDVTGAVTAEGHGVVHGGNYASDVRNTIANAGLEDGIFATGTLCTSSGSVCAEGTTNRTSRIKPFDTKVGTIDTLAVSDATWTFNKISTDYDGAPILMGAQVMAPANSSNVTITAYVDSVEQWTQTVPSDGVERDYYFPAVGGSVDWDIVIAADSVDSPIEFDNVYHGLQPIGYIQSINDVDTDLVTGTCTSSWDSVATTTCKFRRDGDTMSGWIKTTLSGTPSGAYTATLPDGYEIDSAKAEVGDDYRVGGGSTLDNGVNRWQLFTQIASSTTLKGMFITADGSSAGEYYPAANNRVQPGVPFTYGSGDSVTLLFNDLPIQGWETGRTNVTQQRKELTAKTANELSAVVGTGGSVASENYDWISGNCTNSSTGIFECSYVTGLVSQKMSCTATALSSSNIFARFSTTDTGGLTIIWLTDSGSLANPSSQFNLNCSKQGADVNKSINVDGYFNSSQINFNDTVAARYTRATSQSIPTGTDTTVIYNVLGRDENNSGAYNTTTGVYTVPVSGWYQINAAAFILSVGSNTAVLKVNVDSGSEVINLDLWQSGSYANASMQGWLMDYFTAGQTIEIQVSQTTGSSKDLDTGATNNYFSIARVR